MPWISNYKHDFLLKEFDFIPEIGWQIDPFGHSSSNAKLFSQMGFQAIFFARIDYDDKYQRLNNQSLEMIWHPRSDSGGNDPIFTHVNFAHYSSPPGFDFDYQITSIGNLNYEPIIVDN